MLDDYSRLDPNFNVQGWDGFNKEVVILEPRTSNGNIIPAGSIWETKGVDGTYTLVRATDPTNPREEPYTIENQNTGVWAWLKISERPQKWEFLKDPNTEPPSTFEFEPPSRILQMTSNAPWDIDPSPAGYKFTIGQQLPIIASKFSSQGTPMVLIEFTNYYYVPHPTLPDTLAGSHVAYTDTEWYTQTNDIGGLHWNYYINNPDPDPEPEQPQETKSFTKFVRVPVMYHGTFETLSANQIFYERIKDAYNYEEYKILYFCLDLQFNITYKTYTNLGRLDYTLPDKDKLWWYEIELRNVKVLDPIFLNFAFKPTTLGKQYVYEENWWMWLKELDFQVKLTPNPQFFAQVYELDGSMEEIVLDTTSSPFAVVADDRSKNPFTGNRSQEVNDIVFTVPESKWYFKYSGYTGNDFDRGIEAYFVGQGNYTFSIIGNNGMFNCEVTSSRTWEATALTPEQQIENQLVNLPFKNSTLYTQLDTKVSSVHTIPYPQQMETWVDYY